MSGQNPNEVEEMQRANEAKFLLEHPMIVGALAAIEGHFERSWKQTKIGEKEAREEAFGMLKCAQTFRLLLTEYVTTGRMASVQKESRTYQDDLHNN